MRKTRFILNALSEYQNDLERGNYETLKYYDSEWNKKEILPFIDYNLKTASEKVPLSPEELASFLSQIEKEQHIIFTQFAQFFVSLNLLMTQKQVKPEEELEQLEKAHKMLYIETGMPGLCLAYLNAVERSSLTIKSKLSSMGQILIKLGENKEIFGALSDLVIQVAVSRWLNLLEQLDKELRKNFLKSAKKRQDLAASCLNIKEAQEKLTAMEKCTLKILEKLNHDIGKINFFEPNLTTILEDRGGSKNSDQELKELSYNSRQGHWNCC